MRAILSATNSAPPSSSFVHSVFDASINRGTSSTLSYFTSYHDDSVGGDTNGDGSSTNATSGDWQYVKLNSGASTTFNGAVIRYGGSDATTSTIIYNNGGKLTMNYADVSFSGYYGLKINSGTTTITNSMIRDNRVAIDIDAGSATIASSSIFNNSDYGALQTSGPTSTMTNNFWGGWFPLDDGVTSTENSGPYQTDTNPSGGGNIVSPYINYSSYIAAYLAHPNVNFWSPPGVNTNVNPYEMRVGSSTQYQAELIDGINTWNASSSNYVRIIDASASSSDTWDIYVADIAAGTSSWGGLWIPSTTSTPYILFNTGGIDGNSVAKQCTATHELGHALGLAHDPSNDDIMYSSCFWPLYGQTNLGSQDLHDFNMLWSPAYFFDPHGIKGIIQ